MNKTLPLLLIGLFVAAFSTVVIGQDPCASYYGKGYCVDYIKQRLGTRPFGDPAKWRANVQTKDVRVGDAALFSSPTPWGHVAIVERVVYRHNTAIPISIDISEWNYGPSWTNKRCAVTNKFGTVNRRNVSITSAERILAPVNARDGSKLWRHVRNVTGRAGSTARIAKGKVRRITGAFLLATGASVSFAAAQVERGAECAMERAPCDLYPYIS